MGSCHPHLACLEDDQTSTHTILEQWKQLRPSMYRDGWRRVQGPAPVPAPLASAARSCPFETASALRVRMHAPPSHTELPLRAPASMFDITTHPEGPEQVHMHPYRSEHTCSRCILEYCGSSQGPSDACAATKAAMSSWTAASVKPPASFRRCFRRLSRSRFARALRPAASASAAPCAQRSACMFRVWRSIWPCDMVGLLCWTAAELSLGCTGCSSSVAASSIAASRSCSAAVSASMRSCRSRNNTSASAVSAATALLLFGISFSQP